jgi:hypothetical protein
VTLSRSVNPLVGPVERELLVAQVNDAESTGLRVVGGMPHHEIGHEVVGRIPDADGAPARVCRLVRQFFLKQAQQTPSIPSPEPASISHNELRKYNGFKT